MKLYLTLFFYSVALLSASAQNIPIDFEANGNGAEWNWTVFENDTNPALEIVANPDPTGFNSSATVAKFTALSAGQPFAGCETLHGAGIGSFTIDNANAIIRILVWKSVISDVGIKLVRNDNWSLGEIKIANTQVDQWEQLTFDFSAHIGNTYDQIVIFPDFDARQSDNIIYFDGIYGDVAINTAITDLGNIDLKLFPNPALNTLTIQSSEPIDNYKIYSISGELVAAQKTAGITTAINIDQLAKGMYLMKATSSGQTIIEKFIKE